jgi:hypothetical protein
LLVWWVDIISQLAPITHIEPIHALPEAIAPEDFTVMDEEPLPPSNITLNHETTLSPEPPGAGVAIGQKKSIPCTRKGLRRSYKNYTDSQLWRIKYMKAK